MSDWGSYFLPVLLPTLAIYVFLIWGLVRFTKQSQLTYLLAALAPFAWWGCSVGGSLHAKANAGQEQIEPATVAAPAFLPDTIVFQGRSRFLSVAYMKGLFGAKSRFGFRYVVYPRRRAKLKTPGVPTMVRYNLEDRIMKPELINKLPAHYIALRAANAATLASEGHGTAPNAVRLEMWYIDGDRSDLIGMYYEPNVAVPMFPPVLTSSGWQTGSNSIGISKLKHIMVDFMSRSLRRT